MATPLSSDQLAAYNAALTSSTPIQMTAGGSNQGLSNFFNSPEYAAMYGSQSGRTNATNAASGTYNPIAAFQNSDPSYQFQIDQALRNVNNSSAAKGLLESGQTQRDLLGQAQVMQNSQYQNWLGQQNSLFNNYQGQLQQL